MTIFLIEYDRARGRIVRQETFPDTDRFRAEDSRLKREMELRKAGPYFEVVLLEAASEDALRHTHRRYFDSVAEIARAASS